MSSMSSRFLPLIVTDASDMQVDTNAHRHNAENKILGGGFHVESLLEHI